MENIKGNRTQVILLLIVFVMIAALGSIYLWGPETDNGFINSSIKGTIGVIEIYGVLDDTNYAYLLSQAVQEAITDDDVKVVVLEIDSPGGYAYLTEQVYMDILELKSEKPVVAFTSMALSGGYYIAVAADYIFALPSSMVGNVGVMGSGPGWIVPSEVVLETGPHKITGFSPELFPFNLANVLDSFAWAVEEGRSGKLTISMDEVVKGSIWMGSEAVNNGVVDEIGSMQTAINYAASIAGLDEWDVDSLLFRVANETVSTELRYPTIEELNAKNPPPALYYLYMPSDIYMESQVPDTINVTASISLVGDVIVDLSHDNVISPWILDALAEKLVGEGLYMGYGDDWQEIEDVLNKTKALVIASPQEFYSYEEYTAINEWVNDSGVLIFLGDASATFLDPSVLQAPLNSLSDHWGLHYSNGYLYDVEENYGFYRNLILTDIRDSLLSEGVDELVFYTTGAIVSRGNGVVKTSFNAFNSVSERNDMYSVVAANTNNCTVIAFGDTTWLMKPYINAADNMVLLENLVEVIVSVD